MFCSKCGTQALEGAVYCQKCGEKLYRDEENVQYETSGSGSKTGEGGLVVILTNVGKQKVAVIREIMEWTGIDLKESRQLVEKVPAILKKDVALEEAEAIKAAFRKTGADVAFTDKEGQSVEITVHCKACGAVLGEDSNVCSSCGNILDITPPDKKDKVQNDPTLFGDDVDWKGELNTAKEGGLRELRDKFKAMSSSRQVIIGLASVVAIGFVIWLLVAIIRLIFSSLISIIVVAAGGYVIYHRWVAKWITEFGYGMKSKKLQLPEGMSAQTLLEALSGKFNYPYFKGVRYGEKGECIIEGKYTTYPVVFNEEGMAGLIYNPSNNEKESRAVMLEAIAIRNYVNKFFNPTLSIDVVKDFNKLKSSEKQRKAVSFVLAIASFLITVLIVLQCVVPGGLHNLLTPGGEVRNAYLSQYSNRVTIDEAFENFFENCKWKKYDLDGYSNVVFNGTCEFLGEKVDVRVTFKITGENFIVDSLDLNGRTQSEFMLQSLLSAVYEGY